MTALEAVLRRERVVITAGLAGLTLLAWIYLWRGAGMGMTALQMTSITLFPHAQPETMLGMVMPPITWITVIAMWWIMMIAMMTPSAAPLVLLYARVLRHSNNDSSNDLLRSASVFLLASGYLAVWLLFSIVAAAMQYVLQNAGLISEMMLWSKSALLSAAVLAAAGAYQLSPAKQTCLRHCRGPVDFLTRHWHPGRFGAFAMGVRHGAWCVGCCWMLMALLFVGGVMNVVWIALLAGLVLIEKTTSFGIAASRFTGGLLIAWSVATLAVWSQDSHILW